MKPKKTEQVVLSKAIYDLEYRAIIMGFLEVRDFVVAEHRRIYNEIVLSVKGKKVFDVLILRELFPDFDLLPEESLPAKGQFIAAAHRLHVEGNKYRVRVALDDFLSKADGEKEGFKFEEELEQLRIVINSPLEDTVNNVSFKGEMASFFKYVEDHKFTNAGKTGIGKLDNLIAPFEQSHIYSFVAASGVGKTMMGIQIMDESMEDGVPCLYISNEMNKFEIISRFLARRLNWSAVDIRRNNIGGGKRDEYFVDAMGEVDELIMGTSSAIMDGMISTRLACQAIRKSVIQNKTKLVVIDHLHNFVGQAEIYQRVSLAAHDLQAIAQELGVAIVILSQLSLDSQKQKNLEHVTAKGAKDVEEVSNVMVILSRKRLAVNQSLKKEDDPNYMGIAVTKNRDGQTGSTRASVNFPSMVLKQDEES